MRSTSIVLLASSIALAISYPSHPASLHARSAGIVDERDLGFDDEGLAERHLETRSTYGTPPGVWGAVHYPPGTGANLPSYPAPPGRWGAVHYPAGTGSNLPHYAPPLGGWGKINYPQGSGAYSTPPMGSPAPTKEPTKASAALKYAAPPGGWGAVHYPLGTGANLPSYPAPPGGWGSVHYPAGTGANLIHYPAPPGGWGTVHYRAPSANRTKVKQVASIPHRYASLPRAMDSVAYSTSTAEKLPSHNAPSEGHGDIHYPFETEANLPYYPAPPGGW